MLDENDSTTTEAAPETTDSGPAPTPEDSTETSPAGETPAVLPSPDRLKKTWRRCREQRWRLRPDADRAPTDADWCRCPRGRRANGRRC